MSRCLDESRYDFGLMQSKQEKETYNRLKLFSIKFPFSDSFAPKLLCSTYTLNETINSVTKIPRRYGSGGKISISE